MVMQTNRSNRRIGFSTILSASCWRCWARDTFRPCFQNSFLIKKRHLTEFRLQTQFACVVDDMLHPPDARRSYTIFCRFGDGVETSKNLSIVWKQLIFLLKELTTYSILLCIVRRLSNETKIFWHQIAATQTPKLVRCSLNRKSLCDLAQWFGWLLLSRSRLITSAQTAINARYVHKSKSVIVCKHYWRVCPCRDDITQEFGEAVFRACSSLSPLLDECMQLF